VSTAYLDEYVRSEVVPKLKKYIYSKDKVKVVWDLNELRKLLESITNIPPDDVIDVMVELGMIEVKNNQAIIKITEEG
jgi:bisphosphoglycerate-dependent phosphoglycerate mutase